MEYYYDYDVDDYDYDVDDYEVDDYDYDVDVHLSFPRTHAPRHIRCRTTNRPPKATQKVPPLERCIWTFAI